MSPQLAVASLDERQQVRARVAELPVRREAAAAPSTAQLLASGCGTAVAAVCATGIVSLTGSAPGLWALLAVLCGGGLAWLLAGAFALLSGLVPGRAGLLAYLGRGLGRRAALLLTLPYLLASLFLVGAEACVVGRLLACASGGPAELFALLFLLITWLLCRRGIRLSLRLQGLATWLLLAALALVALYAIVEAQHAGRLWPRLLAPSPSLPAFLAAVSQALFLYMGFELVTSQSQPASPRSLRLALRGSVLLLTGFYGLLALALLASPLRAADAVGLSSQAVPQLALAERVAGQPAVWLIALLSLLASYTSFNGALLALSRLAAALATLGHLPSSFAHIDGQTLLPRRALFSLLLFSLLSTAVVMQRDLVLPAILATAPLAAAVYAGVAWAQQAPAFSAAPRPRTRRWIGRALALGLLGVGLGSLVSLRAQPSLLRSVLSLLAAAYGATLLSLSLAALRRARGSR